MEKPKTLEQLRAEKERAETRLAQEGPVKIYAQKDLQARLSEVSRQ